MHVLLFPKMQLNVWLWLGCHSLRMNNNYWTEPICFAHLHFQHLCASTLPLSLISSYEMGNPKMVVLWWIFLCQLQKWCTYFFIHSIIYIYIYTNISNVDFRNGQVTTDHSKVFAPSVVSAISKAPLKELVPQWSLEALTYTRNKRSHNRRKSFQTMKLDWVKSCGDSVDLGCIHPAKSFTSYYIRKQNRLKVLGTGFNIHAVLLSLRQAATIKDPFLRQLGMIEIGQYKVHCCCHPHSHCFPWPLYNCWLILTDSSIWIHETSWIN